ncbi:MAG: sigma-54-dependent transcriptional regulator [Spirochaetota bacterium]
MARVLLVDPDDATRRDAREHLEEAGYTVFDAGDAVTAELLLDDMAFDVVVGDTGMDEGKLLDLVSDTGGDATALLILLTDSNNGSGTAESVSGAAFDYLQRPFEATDLEHRVKQAVEFKRLHYEAQSLRGERSLIYKPENFVGESEAIKKVFALISKVAQSDSSVLLTGETGTGKELAAGSIHYNSGRASNAFVKVNCAALPDELLESELFGHEKGAYTGAVSRRIGRFEQADGGSIFLDEIGDMSLVTQAKVLRVIQEKEFERLGGSKTISCDVRIISATNKDLPSEIEAGRFRQDLYYRLNVISINLPPLREREDDVVLLAYYFVRKFSADLKKRVKRIHPLAVEVLKDHAFPGNVRELQNMIERAVLMSEDDEITLDDLDLSFKKKGLPADDNVEVVPPSGFDLQEVEKGYILQALRISDWNQKEAAKLLNLSPRALNYKIKKHEIKHPSWTLNRPEPESQEA